MRTVLVTVVVSTVPVCPYVMGHIFVYWSNVLAGVVSWSITCG